MDFSFTPEQEELRAHARAFLAERFPAERVAELADSEAGWDPASWPELAELGWLGVSLPEADGGAGLGFVEEAILLEELGRALYPGPYLATLVALPFVDDPARVARGGQRWSFSLDGRLVPDLALVDRVVGAAGTDGEPLETVDATRRLGRLASPAATADDRLRTRALAALAVEAVGVGSRALELAVEHARAREQFGRPVGSYQAVSHRLADSYLELELARSLAYWAAWCVGEEEPDASVAAAAAKAYAAEAAVAACERAIQVHGGIGFTWEHILHRLYKRALWLDAFGGHGTVQRATVAASLL